MTWSRRHYYRSSEYQQKVSVCTPVSVHLLVEKTLPNQKVELRRHEGIKRKVICCGAKRCGIQKSVVKVKLIVEELIWRRILRCLNSQLLNPAPSEEDLWDCDIFFIWGPSERSIYDKFCRIWLNVVHINMITSHSGCHCIGRSQAAWCGSIYSELSLDISFP